MSVGTTRSFDPFRVLSAEERAKHLKGYLEHLAARDGEIDLAERRLTRREVRFAELEAKPVEWTGETDLEGFYEHYRDEGQPEIDQRTAWLVAVTKANQGESYGVDIELSRFFADPAKVERADPRYLHLMLEEHYHTRILRQVGLTCGIDPERRLPAPLMRVMIHVMTRLPEWVRWTPILAGEVLGTEVFKLLREWVRLFDEQPELLERLDSLLEEIWIDEVFHVAYLRAKIGPWGARLARLMLPLVVWSLMRDLPQLAQLGWSRKSVVKRIRRRLEIPAGIEWMTPDPS